MIHNIGIQTLAYFHSCGSIERLCIMIQKTKSLHTTMLPIPFCRLPLFVIFFQKHFMAHTIVINIINRIKNTIVLVRKISSLSKKKPLNLLKKHNSKWKKFSRNQRIGKTKKEFLESHGRYINHVRSFSFLKTQRLLNRNW